MYSDDRDDSHVLITVTDHDSDDLDCDSDDLDCHSDNHVHDHHSG